MTPVILERYQRNYLTQYLDKQIEKQELYEEMLYNGPKITWAKERGIKVQTLRLPEHNYTIEFIVIAEMTDAQQTEYYLRF